MSDPQDPAALTDPAASFAAVDDLPLPGPALLVEASSGPATAARHDALAARVTALRRVEVRQPPPPHPDPPASLRLAAWNAERCARVAGAAALLRRAGVGAALLSEMDFGMARSGNRHTARDLAAQLEAGYAFAPEFVELGPGFGREAALYAGLPNAGALHGNALASVLPLRDPFAVRLDRGGAWFGLDWHHRRLGGRVAVGATVALRRGPVLLVSVHLENLSTPDQRRDAMARLVAALPAGVPAAVAGDLNTAALPEAGQDRGWFERPEAHEPLFASMGAAGFDWRGCNAPDQTRRTIPDGRPPPVARRVDWFFTRGLGASSPLTWPAADPDGSPLSDHELITVDVG